MRNPLKTFALTTAQEATIRVALMLFIDVQQRQIDDAMDAGDVDNARYFQRLKGECADTLRVMEEAYREDVA